MLYDNWQFCFYLKNILIQTSQAGDQWYNDTSPFSIPWIRYPSKTVLKGTLTRPSSHRKPILHTCVFPINAGGYQTYKLYFNKYICECLLSTQVTQWPGACTINLHRFVIYGKTNVSGEIGWLLSSKSHFVYILLWRHLGGGFCKQVLRLKIKTCFKWIKIEIKIKWS